MIGMYVHRSCRTGPHAWMEMTPSDWECDAMWQVYFFTVDGEKKHRSHAQSFEQAHRDAAEANRLAHELGVRAAYYPELKQPPVGSPAYYLNTWFTLTSEFDRRDETHYAVLRNAHGCHELDCEWEMVHPDLPF